MKKSIFIAIIATFIITLVVIFSGQKVMSATSDYPFCGSCHAWDGAIAQTNLADTTHGASSPNGVKVRCTDCHLPHDSVLNYIFVKAKNGISEGYTTLTKDPSKKDWINNRENVRKKHTFDSSCLKCHENILAKSEGNITREPHLMHQKYVEFKNTNNAMKCTDCHKHVGHKELGKMLYDEKFHQPDSWEEWEKTRAEK